jgi:hypothetical protein
MPTHMNVRAIRLRLKAMIHCRCLIDDHCLRELTQLEYALMVSAVTRLQALRRLRSISRCPCYFASHCIETLCDTTDQLSADLRAERAARRKAA